MKIPELAKNMNGGWMDEVWNTNYPAYPIDVCICWKKEVPLRKKYVCPESCEAAQSFKDSCSFFSMWIQKNFYHLKQKNMREAAVLMK